MFLKFPIYIYKECHRQNSGQVLAKDKKSVYTSLWWLKFIETLIQLKTKDIQFFVNKARSNTLRDPSWTLCLMVKCVLNVLMLLLSKHDTNRQSENQRKHQEAYKRSIIQSIHWTTRKSFMGFIRCHFCVKIRMGKRKNAGSWRQGHANVNTLFQFIYSLICFINDDHVKGRKGEISVMLYWNWAGNGISIKVVNNAKFFTELVTNSVSPITEWKTECGEWIHERVKKKKKYGVFTLRKREKLTDYSEIVKVTNSEPW